MLCCTLMGVPALKKAPRQACVHCENGCTIYETRPQECRSFLCNYLIDATVDDSWKPNRCNFIMVQHPDKNCVRVHVDTKHPDAWRKEPFYSALIRLARKGAAFGGKVYVRVGDTEITLTPNP
jgi:hypothetical protein